MKRREHSILEYEARRGGATNPRVLDAVATVPRDRFIPEPYTVYWLQDRSLEIGEGQTISQPSLVARMTELLDPKPADRSLEVGAGSGYQAALLSLLAAEVHAMEILPALAARCRATLAELGIGNVTVHEGDGFLGWPPAAPYDVIVVSCAIDRVPQPLWSQLAPGGRLVLPLGSPRGPQRLVRLLKRPDGSEERSQHGDVVFVPMTGPNGLVAAFPLSPHPHGGRGVG